MDKEKYPESFFSPDFISKNDVDLTEGKAPIWWNYFLCGVKGVVSELILRHEVGNQTAHETHTEQNYGYNALMDGKIPPCSGLSSSSAVVVAAALCKYQLLNTFVLNGT